MLLTPTGTSPTARCVCEMTSEIGGAVMATVSARGIVCMMLFVGR